MADGTWFATHDRFFSHPKVRRAGRDAALLFQAGKAYCSSHLTDGVVPVEAVDIIAAEAWTTKKAAGPLVREGLWHESGHDCPKCLPCPDGHYLIHDYLEWNRSRDEAEETRQKKATAGATGNHRRWHVARGVVDPDCDFCQASQADPDPPPKQDRTCDPPAIANGSQIHRKSIAQSQTQESLEESSVRENPKRARARAEETPRKIRRSEPQSEPAAGLDDAAADPDAKVLRAIHEATGAEVQGAIDRGQCTSRPGLTKHVRQRLIDEHYVDLLGRARLGWTARELWSRIENPSYRPGPSRAAGGAA